MPLLWCCVGGGVLEAGLLFPDEEQCSDVYFFFGTRALNVAVFRLDAWFGLLLALGVLLLLQLLPPLSLWLPPLTAERPEMSSEEVNNFPESTSDRPSLYCPSPSELSRALIGSSEVRFCGDLSLFSSESLFSPASKTSPAPRRLPPFARVEGGERRPCFFIGFIFANVLSFLIPQIFYCFALLLASSCSVPSSLGVSLAHPVSPAADSRHLPTFIPQIRSGFRLLL